MKLYLSIGQAELAGFTNIDVTKHQIDLGNLDNICETSECTNLIINDLLKFISYEQIPVVITHLVSKLRHKGKITFIFTDLNSIIREYNIDAIDEKLFNQLMFSNGANCCFSYEYIVDIINAEKITLLNVEINKEQVIISAERP